MIKNNSHITTAVASVRRVCGPSVRSVIHADDAERIVIWMLRRTNERGSGSTARTAAQLFPAAPAAQWLEAMGQLSTELSNSPLAGKLIKPMDNPYIGDHEGDLLALLAVAQSDGNLQHGIDRLNWVAAGRDAAVERALATLAKLLTTAGHKLPDRRPLRLSAGRAVVHREFLDHREKAVLDAVRAWVACFQQRVGGLPAVLQRLEREGLRSAGASVNAVLLNTVMTATRALDVRCADCHSISIDEARIVYAVSLAQRRYLEVVEALLCSWMPAAAARLSTPAISGIGQALYKAGHRLGARDWRFPELHGESSWAGVGEATFAHVH